MLGKMQSAIYVKEDGSLILGIFQDSFIPKYFYSLHMMRLGGNEFKLNDGRFRRFRFQTQQHRIVLDHHGIVTHMSEAIVEWIAENTTKPWSMKGIAQDNQTNLEFSFADSVAAGYFALRWR